MKGIRLLTLLFSLVCLLTAGCATQVQKPTASVTNMTLGEVTPQGFTMNFDACAGSTFIGTSRRRMP